MELLQLILFPLLCSVALGWIARRFNFPYPIATTLAVSAVAIAVRFAWIYPATWPSPLAWRELITGGAKTKTRRLFLTPIDQTPP